MLNTPFGMKTKLALLVVLLCLALRTAADCRSECEGVMSVFQLRLQKKTNTFHTVHAPLSKICPEKAFVVVVVVVVVIVVVVVVVVVVGIVVAAANLSFEKHLRQTDGRADKPS